MTRATVKLELFQRDGWLELEPWVFDLPQHVRLESITRLWRARCAADGCGEILDYERASIDRWPVPGAAGGTYHIDNTRLACRECNTSMGSHDHVGDSVLHGMSAWQRRAFRRAQKRALKPVITPEEIFGPSYVPGDPKPPPSQPRSRQPVDTSYWERGSHWNPDEDETFNSGSTQGSGLPQRISYAPMILWTTTAWGLVWTCHDCGATCSGAREAMEREASQHACETRKGSIQLPGA